MEKTEKTKDNSTYKVRRKRGAPVLTRIDCLGATLMFDPNEIEFEVDAKFFYYLLNYKVLDQHVFVPVMEVK